MRLGFWLRVSKAEKNMPIQAFIAFAIICILVCLTVFCISTSISENIYSSLSAEIEKQSQALSQFE